MYYRQFENTKHFTRHVLSLLRGWGVPTEKSTKKASKHDEMRPEVSLEPQTLKVQENSGKDLTAKQRLIKG